MLPILDVSNTVSLQLLIISDLSLCNIYANTDFKYLKFSDIMSKFNKMFTIFSAYTVLADDIKYTHFSDFSIYVYTQLF
jgi:hypothetical protein